MDFFCGEPGMGGHPTRWPLCGFGESRDWLGCSAEATGKHLDGCCSLQKMVPGRNHEDLQETSRNLSLSLSIGIYIYK